MCVSRADSCAWRRSMTTDPMSAKALWCSGTDQTPWRLVSPMIATEELWPTAGTPDGVRRTGAAAGCGCAGRWRSAVIGTRSA